MNIPSVETVKDAGTCPIIKIPDQSDPLKLLKVLECPICLEVANPPVFTCIGNGHMICAQCRKNHDTCPLCHTVISQNRCYFAEQCMEQISLPCKFKPEGCQEVIRGTWYREHLLVCPHRSVECIIRRCPVKVPISRYFQHLQSDHSNSVNGIENTSKHTVEWWIDGSLQPARWPPYYFTCYNHVFLYMAISTMQGMWEWAWIIANEDEAARFRVSAKMHTVNNLADVQWTGFVHSIRTTVPQIIESGLCFVTNSKDIRNPFLFRKMTDAAAHLQQRYYWNTEVEFFQVKDPPKGFIPAVLTTDANKDRVTKSSALPSGVSGKTSTTAVQGGPGPVSVRTDADPNTDIDGSSSSSPKVGSRSASEAEIPTETRESLPTLYPFPQQANILDTGVKKSVPGTKQLREKKTLTKMSSPDTALEEFESGFEDDSTSFDKREIAGKSKFLPNDVAQNIETGQRNSTKANRPQSSGSKPRKPKTEPQVFTKK